MQGLLGHIAAQGRHGDTELAHVQPWEKQLLTDLGGANTINPNTGLREYYYEYEEDPDLKASGGYEADYSGGIGSDIGEWLKGEADRWGFSSWWRDESYAEEQQRKEYIDKLESDFTSGIGEFKDQDFANMSTAAQSQAISDLMGFDIKSGDMDKYFDKYDIEKENLARTEGAEEIGLVGQRAQQGLGKLQAGTQQAQARGGFAATGNPQLDRHRENIFKGISTEQSQTYGSLLHAVRDMETSYNESMIESAYGFKDAMIDEA